MKNNTSNNTSASTKLGKFFYIFDFIKSSRKLHPGTIALLAINILIPAGLILTLFEGGQNAGEWIVNTLISFTTSIIGVVLSLTPLGEGLAAALVGSKKPRDEIAEYVLPVFNEIYETALENDPTISKKVELRVIRGKKAKVYAVGRHTVLMTEAAADLSAEELKVKFAREFAFISNKDVDLVTFAMAGNLIISLILLMQRLSTSFSLVVMSFAHLFSSSGSLLGSLLAQLANIIYTLMFGWVIALLNKIGMRMVRKDLEESVEYVSDFAKNCLHANIVFAY